MRTLFLSVCAMGLVLSAVAAERPVAKPKTLELAALFGDHAVLQRDKDLKVWGKGAKAGEKLTLTFAGATTWTRANADGSFRFLLPARPAGGPFELSVTAESGASVLSKDVLVGEVWVASGQSNMAFTMGGAKPGFGEPDEKLRCFHVRNPLGSIPATDAQGRWGVATVKGVNGFPAVGGFFAKALSRELGVPVGLLFAAAGGTRIEAWSSEAALASTESGRAELRRYAEGLAREKTWAPPAKAKEPPRDTGPTEEALGWTSPSFDIKSWKTVPVPSSIADLEGRDFNGAVWYVRDVELPAALRGKDLVFRIPGVDKHDRTYVNGTLVGATGKDFELDHYAKERIYGVPARLLADGKARLAIRVWSHIYGGGIGTADGAFSLAAADGGDVNLCGAWRWRIERDCGRTAGGSSGYVPGNANAPHTLFDANIAPLAPFAVRGALWYQGESNENNPQQYRELLGALVRDWRHRWACGPFPFISVQLAGFGYPSDFAERSPWSEIRQAMLDLTFELPDFGIASAVDVGSAGDIHPVNKLVVGERMAKWALHHVYGRTDVVPCGPRPVSAKRDGAAAVVRFTDCGAGLRAKGKLDLFRLRDAHGVWHPATAEIVSADRVRVTAADCAEPVEVRYAWSKNPTSHTLWNDADLPASPFRLDVAHP